MDIETYEQAKALTHPLRMKLINQFADQMPRTSKQLSELVCVAPSKVQYHVKELEKVGLFHLVQTEELGGVIEKYYLPADRSFRFKLKPEENVGEPGRKSPRYEISRAILTDQRDSYLHAIEKTEASIPYEELEGQFKLNTVMLFLTKEEEEQLQEEMSEWMEKWMDRSRKRTEATRTMSLSYTLYPNL